MKKRFLG